MLVACEVAVEYWMALTWSPQAQWLREAQQAGAMQVQPLTATSSRKFKGPGVFNTHISADVEPAGQVAAGGAAGGGDAGTAFDNTFLGLRLGLGLEFSILI